eukprot:gene6057-6759_t
MTILPKKKHPEGKKSEVEFDEVRSRGRFRHQGRERARPTSTENSTECTSSPSLTTSPRYDYNTEVEKRETPDCSSVPYKRTRHRPVVSSSGKFVMGATKDGSRGGTVRRMNDADDEEEEGDGYNSSDEHGPCEMDPDIAKKEADFEKDLGEKKGYVIKKMVPDGACLFRAVADQVYGDQEMHSIVRNHCMDYMLKNADYFSKFVTEDFSSYIHRKKNDYCHGNNVEIQALTEMYNRPIEIYVYSPEPMNIFLSQTHQISDENPPMRLSYHGNVHYNSVIDPYAPAVGVGLGLAGYKPGFADRMMLNSVIRKSEEQVLEEEMLKDKLKATDWEATDETLTDIVAKESYLQWLKDQRKHRPSTCTGSSTAATATSSSSQSKRSPPHPFHDQPSPRPCASGSCPKSPVGSSAQNASPMTQQVSSRSNMSKNQDKGEAAASWDIPQDFSEWDDDRILAAVLAKSQHEYYEHLSGSNACKKHLDN